MAAGAVAARASRLLNYASLTAGAAVAAASSAQPSFDAAGALDDNEELLWVSAAPPPQWLNIRLSSRRERPIRSAGWYCWHSYTTNPRVVELLVGSEGAGEPKFALHQRLEASRGSGMQLFDLQRPLPPAATLLQLRVVSSFGGEYVYMNRVFLFEETRAEVLGFVGAARGEEAEEAAAAAAEKEAEAAADEEEEEEEEDARGGAGGEAEAKVAATAAAPAPAPSTPPPSSPRVQRYPSTMRKLASSLRGSRSLRASSEDAAMQRAVEEAARRLGDSPLLSAADMAPLLSPLSPPQPLRAASAARLDSGGGGGGGGGGESPFERLLRPSSRSVSSAAAMQPTAAPPAAASPASAHVSSAPPTPPPAQQQQQQQQQQPPPRPASAAPGAPQPQPPASSWLPPPPPPPPPTTPPPPAAAAASAAPAAGEWQRVEASVEALEQRLTDTASELRALVAAQTRQVREEQETRWRRLEAWQEAMQRAHAELGERVSVSLAQAERRAAERLDAVLVQVRTDVGRLELQLASAPPRPPPPEWEAAFVEGRVASAVASEAQRLGEVLGRRVGEELQALQAAMAKAIEDERARFLREAEAARERERREAAAAPAAAGPAPAPAPVPSPSEPEAMELWRRVVGEFVEGRLQDVREQVLAAVEREVARLEALVAAQQRAADARAERAARAAAEAAAKARPPRAEQQQQQQQQQQQPPACARRVAAPRRPPRRGAGRRAPSPSASDVQEEMEELLRAMQRKLRATTSVPLRDDEPERDGALGSLLRRRGGGGAREQRRCGRRLVRRVLREGKAIRVEGKYAAEIRGEPRAAEPASASGSATHSDAE